MMGFGSTHVYKYDYSDEESLSEEEYEQGLVLEELDEVDDADTPDKQKKFSFRKRSASRPRSRQDHPQPAGIPVPPTPPREMSTFMSMLQNRPPPAQPTCVTSFSTSQLCFRPSWQSRDNCQSPRQDHPQPAGIPVPPMPAREMSTFMSMLQNRPPPAQPTCVTSFSTSQLCFRPSWQSRDNCQSPRSMSTLMSARQNRPPPLKPAGSPMPPVPPLLPLPSLLSDLQLSCPSPLSSAADCQRPSVEENASATPPKSQGMKKRVLGTLGGFFSRSRPSAEDQTDTLGSLDEEARAKPKRGQRRCRRADTNVVTVKLDALTKPGHMHTGEAERCANCSVVFSQLSKLIETAEADEKIWNCEFCGHTNILDLMPEEVPKADDLTYMLEPAVSTTSSGNSGIDESLVIFCIDISGSMCVTVEVPGKVHLRGDHLSKLQALNTERENQFQHGQRRDTTYVSRLQGMQAAVDHQLEAMKKEHPNRRVAVVAFNNEVIIYGDGSKEPIHLAEHRLCDKDDLITMGSEAMLPKSINASRQSLGDKIFDLEEGGATALGPAVLFSVALACQVPGSKVIVCTDGKANVGLGALDVEDLDTGAQFYKEVAELAVSKGVSVSVTTIKGTDCRMEELGSLADATGGQVNIVDPMRLTQEFGTILADQIIATNVTATFITHKGLYMREEGAKDNKVVRYVGNVTLNSEITFEFGIKGTTKTKAEEKKSGTGEQEGGGDVKIEDIPESKGEDMDVADQSKEVPEEGAGDASAMAGSSSTPDVDVLQNLKDLPFQLQVTYTDMEGAKALRVITQSKPVTTVREVAEKALNVKVLGVHAAQRSANLVQDGEYDGARMMAHSNNRLVQRYMKRSTPNKKERQAQKSLFGKVFHLERNVRRQQDVEKSRGLDLDNPLPENNIQQAQTRANLRSKIRDDDLATTTYKMKRQNYKDE